ncbi:MAG: hypothetical protein AAF934_02070 [Bacteroidota bacterium]
MSIVQHLSNASARITNAISILSTPNKPVLSCDLSFTGPYAAENRALSTLYNNFEVFDTARQGDLSKADGIVSREDLEAAALRDDEIGEAARYILSRPDLFQFLDTGSNNKDYMDKVEEGRFHATGGDGRISQEDILAYLGKRTVNDILQDVHAQIDVEANGGSADGVLSRNDYEAFLRSGNATPEQKAAIEMVLQHGAVDGEQGYANDFADYASTVGNVSGWAALGAAFVAAGAATLATGGVGAPALLAVAGFSASLSTGAGYVSLAASGAEMSLGAVTRDPEHVVNGGVGLVSNVFGVKSGAIAEGLGRGKWTDFAIEGVGQYTDLAFNELMENSNS